MKLGILVNTNAYLDDVIGITNAAVSKGHEVGIFVMDEGTRLLETKEFVSLCGIQGMNITYCNYNVERLGVSKEISPDEIVCGSQYDNAVMVHNADKVIVL